MGTLLWAVVMGVQSSHVAVFWGRGGGRERGSGHPAYSAGVSWALAPACSPRLSLEQPHSPVGHGAMSSLQVSRGRTEVTGSKSSDSWEEAPECTVGKAVPASPRVSLPSLPVWVSVQLVSQSTFPLWLPGPQPTTGRETERRGGAALSSVPGGEQPQLPPEGHPPSLRGLASRDRHVPLILRSKRLHVSQLTFTQLTLLLSGHLGCHCRLHGWSIVHLC